MGACPSVWALALLALGALGALLQEASTQHMPKIIRTAPIVIPCQNCGNFAKLVQEQISGARQCASQTVSNDLIQPEPTIQQQDTSGCGCGCDPCDTDTSERAINPVSAMTLAAPIASFLSTIMGGLNKDAVTFQFEDGSLNCSTPSPCETCAQPELPPPVTEDKIVFGVCQDPVDVSRSSSDVDEDSLYVINESNSGDQCTCQCQQSLYCPHRQSPPESWNYQPQSSLNEHSHQQIYYNNPGFEYAAKTSAPYYQPKSQPILKRKNYNAKMVAASDCGC